MRITHLAVIATALCFTAAATAAIDQKNFDLSVKPQDDFNQFANGGWLKANPIPAAYSSWGAFHELEDNNQKALHTILENAAKAGQGSPIEKMVGDFYASGMDTAAIDAAGIAPIKAGLASIDAIKDLDGVQAMIANFHRTQGWAGFAFVSEQDPKDTTRVISAIGQNGLGLPERDYYTRDDESSKKIRDAYVVHVAKMLELAGDTPEAAKAGATAVMTLETTLAKGSRNNVELRDPVANYNKMTQADLQKLTPHFDWATYFKAIGLAKPGDIDVGQPDFMKAFDAALTGNDLATWKAYFRWHLIHNYAPYLSAPLVDENFAFYGKTLTGAQQLRERWKRVLTTVDGEIGEALGQLYVKDYFPPESKARMLALVGNLRAALRERLQTLEWMDETTRQKAIAKLDAFGVKIGYPDKWIDYSPLKVDRASYLGNVVRAQKFNFQRDLAKIGQPMDRKLWSMTPPTVNAYYDPTMNEIVFPAGILQPPFFDNKADDAVNYGGIGAVIGHEMTHGFDDQGRQFAADGNLTDWWTPESAKRFEERSKGIVKQFSDYVAIDTLHIKGELTQGENIADLGGIKIAYAALQKALAGKSREKIDGYTPEQRFFLSWATVWHTNTRDQALRLQVNTDPHSPAKFRVNAPLSNLEEFYKAFAIPEGAPMRRAEADRVIIW